MRQSLRILVIGLLIGIGVLALPVLGQEADAFDTAACETARNSMIMVMAEYATATDPTSADEEAVMTGLEEMARSIAVVRAICQDLHFDSESDGLLALLGPVVVPTGIYRIRVITEGTFILNQTILSGECETQGRTYVFNASAGQASGEGAQASLISAECIWMLEVSSAREPWELIIEPLM
jgi:hypothetical protein